YGRAGGSQHRDPRRARRSAWHRSRDGTAHHRLAFRPRRPVRVRRSAPRGGRHRRGPLRAAARPGDGISTALNTVTVQPPDPARTDLRLVPAAIGAWAAVLIGLWIGWMAAAVLAAGSALVTLVGAWAVAGRGGPRLRPPWWMARVAAVLLAAGA